jgi:DNA polymerase III epsilon subunit-like protein
MRLDSLLVLDVETTGLHPARNSVLSLGVVVVNRYLFKTFRMNWHVRLGNPFEVLTKEYRAAQRIHGISTRAALFRGDSVEEVVGQLIRLRKMYPDALLAGINVGFDAAFLNRMFEQAEEKNPFDYHLVDLTGLAAVHLGVTGLKNIMAAVGLDPEGFTQHDALGDAEATADALIALLKMIENTDRLAGERVAEIGKEAGEAAVTRLRPKAEADAINALNVAGDEYGF